MMRMLHSSLGLKGPSRPIEATGRGAYFLIKKMKENKGRINSTKGEIVVRVASS